MKQIISFFVLISIVAITFWAYFTFYYGWRIYLEIFSHFQAQYLAIALILFSILLILRRSWQIYIGLFLCTMLSLSILTWYFPPNFLSSLPIKDYSVRILIANVNAQNTNYEQVLDLVTTEKPDVAIFLEATQAWQNRLDSLKDVLPYSSERCSSCNLGILIYSNQLLREPRFEYSSIMAELNIAEQPVTLVATHPFAPLKPQMFHSRNQQLDVISDYLARVDHRVIVAGDFNITMWSPYYRRFISKTSLKNTRKGFGILPTWPTNEIFPQSYNWFTSLFSIPIDHCLISQGFKVMNIYTGQEIGSDHLPLIVDLAVVN